MVPQPPPNPRGRPYSEAGGQSNKVAPWPREKLPETTAALACSAAVARGLHGIDFEQVVASLGSVGTADPQITIGVGVFWALCFLLPGPTRPAAGGGLFVR